MAFIMRQKVLFKHCDPAGIVFYPRYFEILNDAVETFFDTELGFPFEKLHPTNAVPTVHIEMTFSAPSRHGDRLEIELAWTHLGRSSAKLQFEMRCGSEKRLAGQSTLVYTGTGGMSEPWPAPLRASISSRLEGDQL